jgi:von Willebrand factor type D domain/Effector protein
MTDSYFIGVDTGPTVPAMRTVWRRAGVIGVLALVIMMWPAAASASQAEGGPGLEISGGRAAFAQGEPIRLTFAVTNSSAVACGLAKQPEGTVQVMSVRKDGQELTPVLGRSFYLDGIANAIEASMVNAAPGSKVDVALVAIRVHDGPDADAVVLRSVAATPDGGGLDALWPVGAPGRYEVTASYSVPQVEGAIAPCAGSAAAKTVTFTVGEVKSTFPWLWLVIGAALVLLIVLLVVMLLRRRRTAPAAALIAIGLIALSAWTGKPAYADVEVDPNAGIPVPGVDFKAEVAGCMAKYAEPGGDPAGILPRLKDPKTPKVRIIPTTGGSNTFETPKSPDGKGSSTITWNPISTDPYENDVARNPCAALYHEISHANDISKDTVPQGDCGNTGIKTAEVKATFAENKYRTAKGLPPRQKYDGKDLPKNFDDCKKKPDKKPPQKGPVKLCEGAGKNQCGSTNGDPHLVTFDRAYYDFQAVGEFVVVRSTGGAALQVQARQAPMGASRTASINTALAFLSGTQKIEFNIVDGVTRLRVDGKPAAPDGSLVTLRDSDTNAAGGYDVRWPDGSEAAVDQIGTYGYRLLLKLSSDRAGKVQGLLGNFDGDPENDIAPLNASPLAQPVPFDKLYPSYADSWRVTQKDSLFTYAAGQSTETFTDRKYPEKPMAVKDLSEAARAQAEAICRWAGVTDPWQFLECVFDVGITGRPEFAVSGASSELVAPPTAAPILAAPIASGTLIAGGANRLTFTGRAGQFVFVDAVGPTLDSSCSPFKLLDPAGKQINSGCHIGGIGYIDRTELPADGEYTVLLDPREGITGRASVRVYVTQDVDTTVQPNGALQSVTFERPGSIARYRFQGVAGQRVFVDVPDSSLPHQCSPLELRDPGGREIASGCVIGGVGDIEGTVLPADGTYTVVVDPNDRTLGTVQLRLFMAKDESGTIAVNGQPVVANVRQPGLVLRYEFAGTAGSSVTLTATDGTLPDQCSPLELRDPAGALLASGCVITGVGDIRTTVLPTSGTYTIVVDPHGAATGSVTITLRNSAT